MMVHNIYLIQRSIRQSIYDRLKEESGYQIQRIVKEGDWMVPFTPYSCFLYECDHLQTHVEELKKLKKLAFPYLILCWQKTEQEEQLDAEHILYLDPNQPFNKAMKQLVLVKLKLLCLSKETKVAIQRNSEWVIGIGASTGGPRAISKILKDAPFPYCGTVIVQHMGEKQLPLFADYLHDRTNCEVKNAMENEVVKDGVIYIAIEKKHLIVRKQANGIYLHYTHGDKVNCVCPAIDPLFVSLAKELKNQSIGVLLTGMGMDGVLGLKKMKEAGACTIIQDEATSDLYGMPKEAKKAHAYTLELPVDQIGGYLRQKGARNQNRGE